MRSARELLGCMAEDGAALGGHPPEEEQEEDGRSRKAKREAGGRRSKKGKLHHEPYQPVLSYKYKDSGDSTVHLLTHKSDSLVRDWRKPTEQNGRALFRCVPGKGDEIAPKFLGLSQRSQKCPAARVPCAHRNVLTRGERDMCRMHANHRVVVHCTRR